MVNIVPGLMALGSKILNIIDKHVQDKALKQKLSLEIQREYMQNVAKLEQQLLKSQADIIVSEATGHSWLQRNWRPITMLVFVFIIANNYILVPYGQAFGLHVPILNLPDHVWELIKYGLTGYIGARSVEKITTVAAQTKVVEKIAKLKKEMVEEPKRVPKVKDLTLSLENEED